MDGDKRARWREMGERVRIVRENRGKTVEELARLAGIKAERLRGIEAGTSRATLHEMESLGDALQTYLEVLLRGRCGNLDCPQRDCPLCRRPS